MGLGAKCRIFFEKCPLTARSFGQPDLLGVPSPRGLKETPVRVRPPTQIQTRPLFALQAEGGSTSRGLNNFPALCTGEDEKKLWCMFWLIFFFFWSSDLRGEMCAKHAIWGFFQGQMNSFGRFVSDFFLLPEYPPTPLTWHPALPPLFIELCSCPLQCEAIGVPHTPCFYTAVGRLWCDIGGCFCLLCVFRIAVKVPTSNGGARSKGRADSNKCKYTQTESKQVYPKISQRKVSQKQSGTKIEASGNNKSSSPPLVPNL